jgi:hypothetical protein
MPETREHPLRVQAEAASVLTTRIALDPDFADEFIGVVEGGDKETLEAFARSAGIIVSGTEIIPIPGGVCLCRDHICICVIYRRNA